jgi:hypothetical protein
MTNGTAESLPNKEGLYMFKSCTLHTMPFAGVEKAIARRLCTSARIPVEKPGI